MEKLLKKLYYKGQKRIAIIEAPTTFLKQLTAVLPDVQADTSIDPRFLYDFILAFVTCEDDIKRIAPQAIHNISPDGKLWVAYPRGASGKGRQEVNRDNGWDSVEQTGYVRVNQVSVNDEWSALRFRNIKYVKSAKTEDK